jgi:long-chain acyl-CoA synthetase
MLPQWTESRDQGVPSTCTYPDCTVPDLLKTAAARFPNSTALLFYGTRIQYSEFYHLVTRFAQALHGMGVRPGDRLAIMLPNIPQTVIGYYGALQAGAIVVQTNPLYLAHELETQLRDSGAETILALDLFYSRIQPIQHRTALKRLILTRVQDFLPPLKRLLFPVKAWVRGKWVSIPSRPPLFDFLDLVNTSVDSGSQPPLVGPRPDEPALLQYTGGTTGIPKGVVLTHRNVVANATQCRAWMPNCREGEEVFLGVIPFFHVYGLSTCQHLAIMTGSTLVLLPRFEVREVMHAIQKHRVTVVSAIPMMFMKITDFPGVQRYDLRSLRICLSGASPLHAEVQDRFECLTGVRITQGYGLTEAGPVTHCNPINGNGPRGSIGVPFPDTETRIVDLETGERVLPIGEPGELTVHGPQVMRGYWNNDIETRGVIREGWLYTGDIVRQDASGFFFLVDRKKDMIKTRGENVYPREVEEVLFRHPAVKDAAVAGIPHREFGEAVKAYVVLHDGQRVTEHELIAHCGAALARFKVPSSIAFRQELPRTLVGKVLRRALQTEEEENETVGASGRKAG